MSSQEDESQLLYSRRIGDESREMKIYRLLTSDKSSLAWHVINSLFVAIAFLALIIVSSKVRKSSHSISGDAAPLVRTFFAEKGIQDERFNAGDVVSLTNDGRLTKGAGISIYRFTNAFATHQSVKQLHSVHLKTGGIVLCYTDTSSFANLLYGRMNKSTNTIAWSTKAVSLKSISIGNCDRLEKLNDEVLVLVSRSKLLPVTVKEVKSGHSWDAQFTFGKVLAYLDVVTISPQIAILSTESVALSYYHTLDNDEIIIETMVANLRGLGAAAEFMIASQVKCSENHMSHQIMAYSESAYAICYPNNTAPFDSGASPLTCRPVYWKSNTLTVGQEVSLDYVKMDYFFDMELLSTNRGMVIFTDETIGNGIRGVVVELVKKGDDYVLDFGSSLIVNSGHTSGPLPTGVWTYMNLEVLRENVFIVVYIDLSNDGRVTTVIGELTQSATLTLSTPEYVISRPNPNLNSNYYWIDASVLDNSMFIIVDSMTGPGSQGGGYVSVGVVKNGPLGIVQNLYSPPNQYQVAIKGTVKISNQKLTPGAIYYSSSTGGLVQGDYAGGLSSQNPQSYVVVNGSTIVASRGRVGIALSSSEILIN